MGMAQAELASVQERSAAQGAAIEELQSAKEELRDQLQEALDQLRRQAELAARLPTAQTPAAAAAETPNGAYAEPMQCMPLDGCVDGVYRFLEANDCLDLYDTFVQHEIDADTIPYLTETDLITMGVHSVGRRRKLLTLCQTLGLSPSPAIGARMRFRQR